jgi:hypothetical protein
VFDTWPGHVTVPEQVGVKLNTVWSIQFTLLKLTNSFRCLRTSSGTPFSKRQQPESARSETTSCSRLASDIERLKSREANLRLWKARRVSTRMSTKRSFVPFHLLPRPLFLQVCLSTTTTDTWANNAVSPVSVPSPPHAGACIGKCCVACFLPKPSTRTRTHMQTTPQAIHTHTQTTLRRLLMSQAFCTLDTSLVSRAMSFGVTTRVASFSSLLPLAFASTVSTC